MSSEIDLYLMYAPNQGGWGVFDACSCPDPHGFPEHIYRKYSVLDSEWDKVFGRLKAKRSELVRGKVIPTPENSGFIFPKLSDLLRDDL